MVIVDGAGSLVGTLNFNSIIRGAFQSASIGYWVCRNRNGEGFASAAVAAATRTATTRAIRTHPVRAQGASRPASSTNSSGDTVNAARGRRART
jgi:ribosomal-protein-alanine N-acetyltransferase